MITIMSSTSVAPVEGQVVRPVDPTHVSQAHSFPAHDFFNVVRNLVKNTPAYVSEADKLDALNAVDAYESHVVAPGDQNVVVSENDAAPVEDVTKRVPPQFGGAVPAPQAGPAVDYDQLARALVKAQAEQGQAGDTAE